MTNRNPDHIYDIYLNAFWKMRAGMTLNATDYGSKNAGGFEPFTGYELAALALGIADGKGAGWPMPKAALIENLNSQTK